jgi:hypothetical protein
MYPLDRIIGFHHAGPVVERSGLATEGSREVAITRLDEVAPGLGAHVQDATPLPPDVTFVSSTSARRLAWVELGWPLIFVVGPVLISLSNPDSRPSGWFLALFIGLYAAVTLALAPARVRRIPRLGLYLGPDMLVVCRSSRFRTVTVIPRRSILDVGAREDRLPSRAALRVSAHTTRGTVRTTTFGTVDRSRDELDALLRDWWEPGL